MLTKQRLLGSVWLLMVVAVASGCQVTTNSGMYRAFFRWRAFREPQFVLQRALLSDADPGLWGPKLKTHALKWHDRSFDDARYAYTPRQGIATAGGTTPSSTAASTTGLISTPKNETASRKIPWASANQPARLDSQSEVSSDLPPLPPPGDLPPQPILESPQSEESQPGSEDVDFLEIPLPPPAEEGPIADQPGRKLGLLPEEVPTGDENESSDSVNPQANRALRLFSGQKAQARKQARHDSTKANSSEIRQTAGDLVTE